MLVLITNRKSCMSFRLVPKSLNNLNGVMAVTLRYFTATIGDKILPRSWS